MRAFATLLERLVLSPQRNAKLRLMVDYFGATPDPDRGYALAALTGDLDIPSVKPAMLRALVTARVDETLFYYSYDYVGDLAETIALIWPAQRNAMAEHAPPLPLATVVERLRSASRSEGPRLVEGWLDDLDATGRWALIKLTTGGLRIGVSARLAKQALADLGGKPINEIEEIWHAVDPPYAALFAWLEGRGPRPESTIRAPFRPVMLSHAISDDELKLILPTDYAAEWKWDGIRVQAVNDGGVKRLYTRTGDDISHTFPDLAEGLDVEGAIDGELLVRTGGADGFAPGSFSDLQQRLNRKSVSAKLMETHPAFIRAYDCLVDGDADIRALPFRDRKAGETREGSKLGPEPVAGTGNCVCAGAYADRFNNEYGSCQPDQIQPGGGAGYQLSGGGKTKPFGA